MGRSECHALRYLCAEEATPSRLITPERRLGRFAPDGHCRVIQRPSAQFGCGPVIRRPGRARIELVIVLHAYPVTLVLSYAASRRLRFKD